MIAVCWNYRRGVLVLAPGIVHGLLCRLSGARVIWRLSRTHGEPRAHPCPTLVPQADPPYRQYLHDRHCDASLRTNWRIALLILQEEVVPDHPAQWVRPFRAHQRTTASNARTMVYDGRD